MDSETTGGNDGEGQEQVSSSSLPPSPPAPFRFQGGPQESPFAPPSACFTFEAGPAAPTLDLSSEFPPTNVLPGHPLPYPGYEADVERLRRLEREMEELKKVESDLQARLLTGEDKRKQRRSARLRSPRPPQPPSADVADPVDGKAECRRLQLDESFKSAAAEQAHQNAKRLEAEVRGLAVEDEKQGQRRHGRHKNNGRAVLSAHPPLVRPATTAQPATSFTTTLASSSAAAASQEVERVETEREGVERMEVDQVDTEREDAERPTPPRGILHSLNDQTRKTLLGSPRSVHFR